jgi:hypothetical protein
MAAQVVASRAVLSSTELVSYADLFVLIALQTMPLNVSVLIMCLTVTDVFLNKTLYKVPEVRLLWSFTNKSCAKSIDLLKNSCLIFTLFRPTLCSLSVHHVHMNLCILYILYMH